MQYDTKFNRYIYLDLIILIFILLKEKKNQVLVFVF